MNAEMASAVRQPESGPPRSHRGVQVSDIDKRFGPTHAVRDVTLSIGSDEVTAIMGGNGAGKSTLMRILAGETEPDTGTLSVDGAPVDLFHYSPRQAHRHGVRIVHQELSLAVGLTVAENFWVEHRSARWTPGWRKRAAAVAESAIVENFGTETGIRSDSIVESLSVAQRQIVEISRAASAPGLRVLILDEPTSAMGREYLGAMQKLVRRLRDAGVTVLVITHKMYEIPELSDRVVVLREGRVVADTPTAETTEALLIEAMTGSNAAERSRVTRQIDSNAPLVVRLRDYSSQTLQNVSLEVRRGEVVGLSGLQGAGQTDVLRSILAKHRGIETNGTVAYITGDRSDEGVFALWSSRLNMVVTALRARRPILPFLASTVTALTQPWFDRLRLPPEAADKRIVSLSGGMQQKVLIARGLLADADVLLLNDPTRGVDIHTKHEIYDLVREAADSGKAVLWASSEDREAFECDRVYVMADGRIAAEVTGSEITQGSVVTASFARVEERRAGRTTRMPRAISQLLRRPWFLAALGLVLIGSTIIAQQPLVATYFGAGLVLSLAPVLAIVGLAQMFVIALGDIDLGVGAFLGYVGVVAATALATDPVLGILLLAGGIALYPLVGLLVAVRDIPPIIATLGMSFIWLGLALIVQPTVGGRVPEWLIDLYSFPAPLLPTPIWALIIAAFVGWLVIMRSRLGVLIRAVGSNSAAVANAGWGTLGIRMAAYALAGTFATVAGLIFAAVATSGDANGTGGYTLIAIAAAIIGGCAFSGGKVSPVGVVIAGVMLTLVAVFLSAISVPPVFTAASQGLLLLAVMAVRRIPAFQTEA